jgi:hypothetical protein
MEIKTTSGAPGSSLMLWLALSSWGDVCPMALGAQSGHWSSLQSLGDAVLSWVAVVAVVGVGIGIRG